MEKYIAKVHYIILCHYDPTFNPADIDECSNNDDKCSHMCFNIDGGYNCDCNGGYELDNNGYNCTGIYLVVCINIVYLASLILVIFIFQMQLTEYESYNHIIIMFTLFMLCELLLKALVNFMTSTNKVSVPFNFQK